MTTPPGPTRCFVAPVPSRVSRKRAGVIGVSADPVSALSVKYPVTSAIRSTDPALLRRSTFPLTTETVTRLGTICPAEKLRFDTAGFG